MSNNSLIVHNLIIYGSTHAVIDATCAAVVFSLLNKVTTEYFAFLVILYNFLAFGFQPIFGLIVDKFENPKTSAIGGSIITAFSAILILISPLIAVILAGVGNALFHIGGGTVSLNLTKRKATAPGIFVAPGAFGLFIGTIIAKGGYFLFWPFLLIISVFCILMIFSKVPNLDYNRELKINQNYFELTIILLLLAITVRSLIGAVIVFPWKSNFLLLIILTLFIVFGKAFGGMFGDKYGWTKIAVSSLIVSAPLLAFGNLNPYLSILGMFFFNMTMPITLAAISNTIPGRPGFSFGLTCLALFIGALPTFTSIKELFMNNYIVLFIIFICSLSIYLGLRYYNLNENKAKISRRYKNE